MKTITHLFTAVLMTITTTLIFGVAYPLVVTGLAQILFPDQANGSLIAADGRVVGSALIGQPFAAPEYFHGRPSAAGTGYDAANSSGTNLGPTNARLVDAVKSAVTEARKDNPSAPVPVDLVTSSASGLDPHISPASAAFQVPRVARSRGMDESVVRAMVNRFTESRTLGLIGEPRVNVLMLNLALDEATRRK